MDNRLIIVQSKGRKSFNSAFELLFESSPSKKATHYIEDPKKGLIFLWKEEPNSVKLLVPSDANQAADLAWAWINSKPDKDYLEYMDHDGSNSHGFKVYNETWSRINDHPYSILAVQPVWAWHGK